MNIDKTEANERLAALEAEAAKLREIINREDAPKPLKPADVYENCMGELIFCPISGFGVNLMDGIQAFNGVGQSLKSQSRYLGTFGEAFIEREKVNENYVLRSEVREVIERALAVEDYDGWKLPLPIYKDAGIRIVQILKELL